MFSPRWPCSAHEYLTKRCLRPMYRKIKFENGPQGEWEGCVPPSPVSKPREARRSIFGDAVRCFSDVMFYVGLLPMIEVTGDYIIPEVYLNHFEAMFKTKASLEGVRSTSQSTLKPSEAILRQL